MRTSFQLITSTRSMIRRTRSSTRSGGMPEHSTWKRSLNSRLSKRLTYPALRMWMDSSTPEYRSCWSTIVTKKVRVALRLFGLMQRT